MKNRKKANKHTSLVVLSPIEYRHDDPDGRLATVARTLESEAKRANDAPEKQVLGNCPMLHMARFQILDNLIPEMGQRPPDSLHTRYLLFVAEIDGSVDDFFDAIYNGPQYPFDWEQQSVSSKRHAEFVNNVWGQCIGYPAASDNVFFRQYMHRCRIKVQLPFAAYTYSVAEVESARRIQLEFADFVEANQGLDEDTLLANWQSFAGEYDPFAAGGRLAIRHGRPTGRPSSRVSAHQPDEAGNA